MKSKNQRMLISALAVAFFSLIFLGIQSGEVLAEGDETLGPAQINIADGSDIVTGGIGLLGTTSGTITVAVPAGATVEQVLLYWAGEADLGDSGDATIVVDGNPRIGTLIGTSNLTADTATTYRDDITSLGLVGPGANTLLIEDLNYPTNYGAAVLVIIDDGSGTAEIDIRDGHDHAFIGNPVPALQVTELQTYDFTPATSNREATLIMFFGDVIPGRSNEIEIVVGADLTTLVNPLASVDGRFWDTVIRTVTIPAGVSQVTVQAFSRGAGLPSSLAWNLATLSVPPEPPDCSIGDFVWEDADRDGCQGDEEGIAGVEVRLFDGCFGDVIDTTTTDATGFYKFEGLVCEKDYGIQFVDNPNDIYEQTTANQMCVDGDPDASDKEDSDCGDEGKVCVPASSLPPGTFNDTIDCGYVCEGVIGDFVWLDENEDGCQDEVNTGIEGVDVTISEDCVDRQNPQSVQTNPDGFYEFIGLCPGDYFVEFGNGRPNTIPGQVCDGDPDVSDEKDSNCGDVDLQCVELTRGNFVDQTIDCGKVGPCIKILKDVRDAENMDGNYQAADSCDDAVPINNGAEYRLTVTNCGREELKDVKINDPQLGIMDFPVGNLAVGETKVFFFDRPAGGIPELKQPGLCEKISPDLEFLNVSTVEGAGLFSNLPVTDVDPACVECQPECDIKVTKTCEIPPPPPSGDLACVAKIAATTLLYIGPDKNDATVMFDGKSEGDATYSNVDLVSGVTVLTDPSQNGFTIDARPDDLGSKMTILIDGIDEVIHTSCSTPYVAGQPAPLDNPKGDPSPNWLVLNFVDKEGNDVALPPDDPDGFPTETEVCEFTPQPEGGNCKDIKDITALTLVWNGPSGLNIASEVGQVINNIQKGDVIVLDTPKDQTGNDVEVTLTGSVDGASEFHISCSDDDMNGPEDCGSNQGNGKSDDSKLINDWLFGGMTGEKGSFSCPGVPGGPDSAEVIYGIRVANPNAEPVEVRIFDAKLGIDQTEMIPANDTFELVTDPITIMPDDSNEFTNTVVVTAKTETGATCEASDSVTVKRNPPPPEPLVCTTKIAATLLRYIGPEMLGVDVEFVPKEKNASPVTYSNVDLISGITVLSIDGFTIDARPNDLGSKMSIFIGGNLQEVHHTSCSTPYVAGAPAPLDGNSPSKPDKGDPSPNWFVESFVQK